MGKHELSQNPNSQIPLSISQQEVWLDQMAWPGSPHLNIGGTTRLTGQINLTLLQEGLNILISQNDILRMIPSKSGQQTLLDTYKYELKVHHFAKEENPLEAALEWQRQWMAVPFEFDATPPWRIALLKIADDAYLVPCQYHHTLMDGWGTLQVLKEWSSICRQIIDNGTEFGNQSQSYCHFIENSQKYRESESFKKDETFWDKQIKELSEPLFDRRYQSTDNKTLPNSHIQISSLSRAFYSELESAAASSKSTPYHWLLAATVIYFSKIAKRDSIVIGVPSLNRSGRTYKTTLGMFVNVIMLKIEITSQDTVESIINQISKQLRAAYRHSRYPLSYLAKKLGAVSQGRESVIDLMLSYEKQDFACDFGTAVLDTTWQTFSGKARYPLGITICEFHKTDDVELVLEGNETYFSSNETRLLGERIKHILGSIATNPKASVGTVSVIPESEKANLIGDLSAPTLNQATVVERINRAASIDPEATALQSDYLLLSYQELQTQANELARRLIDKGVKKGDIVALGMSRGPEVIVSMVGILKAGAAFLPLDIEAPIGRIDGILQDSAAKLLVIQDASWERFSPLDIPLLVYKHTSEATTQVEGPADVEIGAEDLAYVLFTSGSTGKPKGVMVPHGSLAQRIDWIARHWDIGPRDCSVQATQLNFDPALIEIFVPLIKGAKVAIPQPGRLLPESLPSFAAQHQATMMAFVPSTLQRFLDGFSEDDELNLQVSCCGGEVLSPALAQRFVSATGADLYNVYGPTEATIFATAQRIKGASSDLSLPVGFPLDGVIVRILDKSLNLLPYGTVGQVYLGGTGLATGYLNRRELTESVFIEDPYIQGQKLYKTGDLGWQDTEGNLHFVGREDKQIKLRGYRIELGEIEAALLAIEHVEQAAVKLVNKEGKTAIFAWVACAQNMASSKVLQELNKTLPDYMLPSKVNVQASLPITSNGKIDYSSLTETFVEIAPPIVRKPSGSVEQKLLKLWKKSLKNKTLTVNDNFFEQGGDSLEAVILLAKIEKELAVKLSLHQLVEAPTVAELAETLTSEMGLPKVMVSLGTTTRSSALYIAASGHRDRMRFDALAKEISGACDLHMLQPPGGDLELNIERLGQLYADRIESRGDKKIYLAGFSVGGLAALETAKRLKNKGIKIESLFLVDTVAWKLPIFGLAIWKCLGWLAERLPIFNFEVNGAKFATIFSDTGLYSQVRGMRHYRFENYESKAVLIKSSALASFDKWLFNPWRKWISKLEVRQMDGSHGNLFKPGKIEILAKILLENIKGDNNGGPPAQ